MSDHRPHPSRAAFTLVELSIVLVIIALMTGGILAGKSLIRAAQLRSVITDANNYLAATANFRSQYKYLPGDMPNATKYWDKSTACGGTATTNEATCDGDADGMVGKATSEEFRFWQHLKNAGMIDPKLSGVAGGGGSTDSTPGINVPAGRIASSGFSAYYFNTSGASSYIYAMNYGNMITYGLKVTNSEPTTAVIPPADAYTVDLKIDDGKPATGKWIANSTGGGVWSNATACTTSTGISDFSGSYNLSASAIACSFFIMTGN